MEVSYQIRARMRTCVCLSGDVKDRSMETNYMFSSPAGSSFPLGLPLVFAMDDVAMGCNVCKSDFWIYFGKGLSESEREREKELD